MTDSLHEAVAVIEARVAERFRADASLTSGAARWAVLLEATPVERDAYLAMLALSYEMQSDAEAEDGGAAPSDGEPEAAPDAEAAKK